jgi:hypothetical protein
MERRNRSYDDYWDETTGKKDNAENSFYDSENDSNLEEEEDRELLCGPDTEKADYYRIVTFSDYETLMQGIGQKWCQKHKNELQFRHFTVYVKLPRSFEEKSEGDPITLVPIHDATTKHGLIGYLPLIQAEMLQRYKASLSYQEKRKRGERGENVYVRLHLVIKFDAIEYRQLVELGISPLDPHDLRAHQALIDAIVDQELLCSLSSYGIVSSGNVYVFSKLVPIDSSPSDEIDATLHRKKINLILSEELAIDLQTPSAEKMLPGVKAVIGRMAAILIDILHQWTSHPLLRAYMTCGTHRKKKLPTLLTQQVRQRFSNGKRDDPANGPNAKRMKV